VESIETLFFSALAIAQSLVEGLETVDKSNNAYVTMIYRCSDLDAVQKFHYLRSSLSGTALQVISAFEFTPKSYNHAWELLENRFNNTRFSSESC
jgi:hypothetical protein